MEGTEPGFFAQASQRNVAFQMLFNISGHLLNRHVSKIPEKLTGFYPFLALGPPSNQLFR